MTDRSDAFDRLAAQLTPGALQPLLGHIRTLTAVLDADGVPMGWNPAFDAISAAFPSAAEGPEFQQALQHAFQTRSHVHVRLDIESERYDCLLVVQSNDRVLLLAEPDASRSKWLAESPDGSETIDKLKAELETIRLALDVKQKELQAVVAQANEVSNTDSLTFLPNRRSMLAELQRQVTYSERYGAPLTLSMIDIDEFKAINDTYGHSAGDQVLRFIASELRDGIRQPDVIGRYGGDEFLVILPNSPANAAAEQATRLCQQVASTPVVTGKVVMTVGLSIGITQYQPNSDDWQKLLDRADQALYQAKNNGRGQWAILKA